MYVKCLCFCKYPYGFYPYPLKFQALNEKEVPFQFTQKFHSRRSENNEKQIEKCTKRAHAKSLLFNLKHIYL